MAIKLDRERLPGKPRARNMRQHPRGVDIDRVAAGRLHDRDAVVGDVPPQVGVDAMR